MTDALLTTEELAERLRVSVRNVRRLVNARRIPAVRLNSRTWRFHWETVVRKLGGVA